MLGSATLTLSEQITEDPAAGVTVVQVTLLADQPLRAPPHPEAVAQIKAAPWLGMRLLKAPRIGNLLI